MGRRLRSTVRKHEPGPDGPRVSIRFENLETALDGTCRDLSIGIQEKNIAALGAAKRRIVPGGKPKVF